MKLFTTVLFLSLGIFRQATALPATHSNLENKRSSKPFKGFRVLEATPTSEDQVSLLREIESNHIEGLLEFWSSPSGIDEPCSLSLHPDVADLIEDFLEQKNVTTEVVIEDLQEKIDQEQKDILKEDEEGLNYRDPSKSGYDIRNYNRFNQISMHLDELAAKYPSLLTIESLATTHEGRAIEVATLAIRDDSKKRSVIVMDCGVHAREWITPSFCIYAITHILQEGRGGLLKDYDFKIIPVLNPDGYEYTWTTNRMWRKNRRALSKSGADTPLASVEVAKTKQFWNGVLGSGNYPGFNPSQFPGFPTGGNLAGQQQQQQQSQRGCTGVDPNRNFDIEFGVSGSSSSPCRDTYNGPYAFSEIESRATKSLIEGLQSSGVRIASYVSVHAYSQFWMSPHGYSKTRAPDYKDHMRVMRVATSALAAVHGKRFKYGPINEVIYKASGSSVDWVYSKAGVKYSFALELRDKGRHGFLLPVDQISSTNEETWAGLRAMAVEIATEFPPQ